jgi:hypothetical protein
MLFYFISIGMEAGGSDSMYSRSHTIRFKPQAGPNVVISAQPHKQIEV